MLKHRIITALILIPLVLLGIFYLPSLLFAAVSTVIFLLAGWEWAGLIGLNTRSKRSLYLIKLFVFFILIYLLPDLFIMIMATLTWITLLYYVFHYDEFANIWKNSSFLRALSGMWILGASWYGLNSVHNFPSGAYYLLFLLLFVWNADTGAYFVGKKWGKHKLAPHISPGKSIEGVLGGTVMSVFVAAIIGWFFYHSFGTAYFNLLLLAFITSLVSVIGDLVESMVKRLAAVKDSGNLLPGHGGLLDRIDSLLSTTPIFALWLMVTTFFT